nr:glycosyltransferase [uncultured Acetobacterium sp.]
MKNEIIVSVSCITFNHENYIAEAIESFIMQKTSFKYEILIHDDASTDKTAEIIHKYEKEYPELIKAIYQKENLYSKDVDVDDLNTERAKGKYIALCEGDDYWLDPYKLQKQVDYMEAHSDCTLCVHAAYIVNVMGKKIKPIRANLGNKIFSVEEIIEGGGGLFATNTMMYPRYLDLNKPDFYKKAPVTDYPLAIYLALKGKVYYIDEYMAAYRKGVSGSWTNTEQSSLEKIIKHVNNTEIMLDHLNQHTGYQFNKAIENKKNINLFKILIAQERFKELREGKFKSVYKNITTKEKTKILIKQYFPRSVKIYKRIRRKYKL